ncbi:hypothetical protein D3C73_1498720 [compost metagenome]
MVYVCGQFREIVKQLQFSAFCFLRRGTRGNYTDNRIINSRPEQISEPTCSDHDGILKQYDK